LGVDRIANNPTISLLRNKNLMSVRGARCVCT
jgi:hypothetical protein